MGKNNKLLFVYNPHAGRGVIKNHLSDIIETFCASGYHVTVRATSGPKDAANYVRDNGEAFDRIVCCGGDGTLNEVTDGIMALKKRPECGYIPAGTVNDFAHSFNLPTNMKEAAKVAMNGEAFLCDIGELNGDYFDYVAAFGVFTNVSYETPQASKNILGKLAYFLQGVKQIAGIKKYHICACADGEEFEDDVIYGMVTNSFSIAGLRNFEDEVVALDDGLLEAFFIKAPKNVMEYQSVIGSLLTGDLKNELFYYRHIKSMTIKSQDELSWTIDGEFGGAFTEMEIVTHHKAVSFIRNNNK